MSQPFIVIIMGSRGDEPFCQKIASVARSFELEVILYVASAHKTPQHLLDILAQCERDERPKVYITVAGRSNALSGFVDGAVSAPVIACPPLSDTFAEVDLYSSLRMPSGIAPALVLDPANAALLAAKILSAGDEKVKAAVHAFQQAQADKIIKDNADLQS